MLWYSEKAFITAFLTNNNGGVFVQCLIIVCIGLDNMIGVWSFPDGNV